jgi:PAS domain S-box-containing protein
MDQRNPNSRGVSVIEDASRDLSVQLRDLEQRYRLLLSAAFEGITVHEHGRHVEVNDAFAALLGYTRDELFGTSAWELAAPESHAIIQAHIQTGSEEPYEVVGIRKDGTRIDLEVRGRTAQLDGRNLRVTSIRDISERRRAQAEHTARLEAEAVERLRDEVLAAASHDLKNPLTVIRLRTELLHDLAISPGMVDPTELRMHAVRIERAVTRMERVLQELADLARRQLTGDLPLVRQRTDLVELARQVVEQVCVGWPHPVRVETEEALLQGWWDSARLERVLTNLLDNALKYSPEGGEIVVSIQREVDSSEPWAVLSVTDQGIGIPTADLPHIFDRFQRGSNAGSITGTGVGLASVRYIIEQHGGSIRVQSQEGQGTTVTARLPLTTG